MKSQRDQELERARRGVITDLLSVIWGTFLYVHFKGKAEIWTRLMGIETRFTYYLPNWMNLLLVALAL